MTVTLLSPRVRINENGVRERQCIGPKKFQRSKNRGLCLGPGHETKGWLPETSDYFGSRPSQRADGSRISQPRCLFCDRVRKSDTRAADRFRDLSWQDLQDLSDEDIALTAQFVPAQRENAFEILIKRTERLRRKAAKVARLSAGYSEEDTLANGMEGVVWAVWNFDRKKKTKFATHAYNWIRRCSDNRSLHSQPLSDQFRQAATGTVDAHGNKVTRERAVNIRVLSAQGEEADTEEAGSVSAFDSAHGGREDRDHALIMDLREKLHILDTEVRAMIERKYYEGVSDADNAEIVGCTRKAASAKIRRGLARLKSAMLGYEGGA